MLPVTWRRPSLARKAIEQNFPSRAIDDRFTGHWDSSHLQKVKFLLDMLSNVDERILFAKFSPEQGVEWRRHLAAVRAAVRRWQSGGDGRLLFENVVQMYRLLKDCPDNIVPKAEPRLTFVTDAKFRASIARDIDSLDVLVRDEEWKAATVIGGSVVEALLLDRLLAGGEVKPEDRMLARLIAIAKERGLIAQTVANICDGARDFRNLIHSSKERAEAPCDKGTALAAVAAVENLVATFNGSR